MIDSAARFCAKLLPQSQFGYVEALHASASLPGAKAQPCAFFRTGWPGALGQTKE
jgi:hypothetical protein